MRWSNSASRWHWIFPSSLSESRNSPSAGLSAFAISHRWTMPSKRHAYPPRLIGSAQHDPLGTSASRGTDHESARERKSVVEGKSVTERVDLGGRGSRKTKT